MARLLAGWFIVSLMSVSVAIAADKKDDMTKAAMGKVYGSISKILPLSLSEKAFSSAANDKIILDELRNLTISSRELEIHAQSKNKNFQYLTTSLEQNIDAIKFLYERGQKEQARLRVYGLTDTCIACHSRLPSTNDFTGAKELFHNASVEKLDLPEKIQLLTATRQFEAALETYETLFSDPKITADDLVDWDPFTSYLILATRVKGDPARAARGLKMAKSKGKFPKYAAAEIDTWQKSLAALPAKTPPNNKLEAARKVLSKGHRLNEYPTDRTGLVDFVYVSGLLLQYLEEPNHSDLELAEAFFLLGLSDAVISRSIWQPQTDFFLETSIRLAPKGPMAQRALAALEDNAVIEYGGSQGIHLPPDFAKTLQELRTLVDGGKTTR